MRVSKSGTSNKDRILESSKLTKERIHWNGVCVWCVCLPLQLCVRIWEAVREIIDLILVSVEGEDEGKQVRSAVSRTLIIEAVSWR